MPDLSEEQQAELFETIDRIRKAGCAAEVDVHGWNVTYTVRGGSKGKSRGAPRGDLTVVDPRDGSKIFSAVALQRKLMGVEEEKPMENVSTSQGNGPSARESIPDTLISSTGRSRRANRTQVNYAEAATSGPRLLDALASHLSSESTSGMSKSTSGMALADLVHAVADEYAVHFAATKRHELPFGPVRMSVAAGLRSGRLRRLLLSAEQASVPPPKTTMGMLVRLVLNTLQVFESKDVPWALASPPGSEQAKAGDGAREGSGDRANEGAGEVGGEGASEVPSKVEMLASGTVNSEERSQAEEEACGVAGTAGGGDAAMSRGVLVGAARASCVEESGMGVAAASEKGQSGEGVDIEHGGERNGGGGGGGREVTLKSGRELQAADAAQDGGSAEPEAAAAATRANASVGCDGGVDANGPEASEAFEGCSAAFDAVRLRLSGVVQHGSGGNSGGGLGSGGGSSGGGGGGGSVGGGGGDDVDNDGSDHRVSSDFVGDRRGDGEDDDDYEDSDDDDDDDDDIDGGDEYIEESVRRRAARRRAKRSGSGGPVVEQLASLSSIMSLLPISELDSGSFACPAGWEEVLIEGSRRPKRRWQCVSEGGTLVYDRRGELEEALEAARVPCEQRGVGADGRAPWLGQIRNGEWQIRSKAAHRALDYVMKYVQDAGLVSLVTSKQSGRATDTYLIRNRYHLGVEFSKTRPKPSRPTKRKLREPEEEEELADIEIERKRNMERNRQLLMQLGLA